MKRKPRRIVQDKPSPIGILLLPDDYTSPEAHAEAWIARRKAWAKSARRFNRMMEGR